MARHAWIERALRRESEMMVAKGMAAFAWVEVPEAWALAFIFKARYVKRVFTGRFRTRKDGRPGAKIYRYFYAHSHGGGVGNVEHMTEGSRFKHGERGHYEIARVDGDTVHLRHSHTGHAASMTKREFGDMLHAHHFSTPSSRRERAAATREVVATTVHGTSAQHRRAAARLRALNNTSDAAVAPREEAEHLEALARTAGLVIPSPLGAGATELELRSRIVDLRRRLRTHHDTPAHRGSPDNRWAGGGAGSDPEYQPPPVLPPAAERSSGDDRQARLAAQRRRRRDTVATRDRARAEAEGRVFAPIGPREEAVIPPPPKYPGTASRSHFKRVWDRVQGAMSDVKDSLRQVGAIGGTPWREAQTVDGLVAAWSAPRLTRAQAQDRVSQARRVTGLYETTAGWAGLGRDVDAGNSFMGNYAMNGASLDQFVRPERSIIIHLRSRLSEPAPPARISTTRSFDELVHAAGIAALSAKHLLDGLRADDVSSGARIDVYEMINSRLQFVGDASALVGSATTFVTPEARERMHAIRGLLTQSRRDFETTGGVQVPAGTAGHVFMPPGEVAAEAARRAGGAARPADSTDADSAAARLARSGRASAEPDGHADHIPPNAPVRYDTEREFHGAVAEPIRRFTGALDPVAGSSSAAKTPEEKRTSARSLREWARQADRFVDAQLSPNLGRLDMPPGAGALIQNIRDAYAMASRLEREAAVAPPRRPRQGRPKLDLADKPEPPRRARRTDKRFAKVDVEDKGALEPAPREHDKRIAGVDVEDKGPAPLPPRQHDKRIAGVDMADDRPTSGRRSGPNADVDARDLFVRPSERGGARPQQRFARIDMDDRELARSEREPRRSKRFAGLDLEKAMSRLVRFFKGASRADKGKRHAA